jgi:hypothetical protein
MWERPGGSDVGNHSEPTHTCKVARSRDGTPRVMKSMLCILLRFFTIGHAVMDVPSAAQSSKVHHSWRSTENETSAETTVSYCSSSFPTRPRRKTVSTDASKGNEPSNHITICASMHQTDCYQGGVLKLHCTARYELVFGSDQYKAIMSHEESRLQNSMISYSDQSDALMHI